MRKLFAVIVAAVAISIVGLAVPASAESRNSVPERNEFIIWEHSNFTGSISDTTLLHWQNYTACCTTKFLNSQTPLNDNASSSENGWSLRVCAWEHAGFTGSQILHLPYGQWVSPTSGYRYSSLGWANDRFSSHRDNC